MQRKFIKKLSSFKERFLVFHAEKTQKAPETVEGKEDKHSRELELKVLKNSNNKASVSYNIKQALKKLCGTDKERSRRLYKNYLSTEHHDRRKRKGLYKMLNEKDSVKYKLRLDGTLFIQNKILKLGTQNEKEIASKRIKERAEVEEEASSQVDFLKDDIIEKSVRNHQLNETEKDLANKGKWYEIARSILREYGGSELDSMLWKTESSKIYKEYAEQLMAANQAVLLEKLDNIPDKKPIFANGDILLINFENKDKTLRVFKELISPDRLFNNEGQQKEFSELTIDEVFYLIEKTPNLEDQLVARGIRVTHIGTYNEKTRDITSIDLPADVEFKIDDKINIPDPRFAIERLTQLEKDATASREKAALEAKEHKFDKEYQIQDDRLDSLDPQEWAEYAKEGRIYNYQRLRVALENAGIKPEIFCRELSDWGTDTIEYKDLFKYTPYANEDYQEFLYKTSSLEKQTEIYTLAIAETKEELSALKKDPENNKDTIARLEKGLQELEKRKATIERQYLHRKTVHENIIRVLDLVTKLELTDENSQNIDTTAADILNTKEVKYIGNVSDKVLKVRKKLYEKLPKGVKNGHIINDLIIYTYLMTTVDTGSEDWEYDYKTQTITIDQISDKDMALVQKIILAQAETINNKDFLFDFKGGKNFRESLAIIRSHLDMKSIRRETNDALIQEVDDQNYSQSTYYFARYIFDGTHLGPVSEDGEIITRETADFMRVPTRKENDAFYREMSGKAAFERILLEIATVNEEGETVYDHEKFNRLMSIYLKRGLSVYKVYDKEKTINENDLYIDNKIDYYDTDAQYLIRIGFLDFHNEEVDARFSVYKESEMGTNLIKDLDERGILENLSPDEINEIQEKAYEADWALRLYAGGIGNTDQVISALAGINILYNKHVGENLTLHAEAGLGFDPINGEFLPNAAAGAAINLGDIANLDASIIASLFGPGAVVSISTNKFQLLGMDPIAFAGIGTGFSIVGAGFIDNYQISDRQRDIINKKHGDVLNEVKGKTSREQARIILDKIPTVKNAVESLGYDTENIEDKEPAEQIAIIYKTFKLFNQYTEAFQHEAAEAEADDWVDINKVGIALLSINIPLIGPTTIPIITLGMNIGEYAEYTYQVDYSQFGDRAAMIQQYIETALQEKIKKRRGDSNFKLVAPNKTVLSPEHGLPVVDSSDYLSNEAEISISKNKLEQLKKLEEDLNVRVELVEGKPEAILRFPNIPNTYTEVLVDSAATFGVDLEEDGQGLRIDLSRSFNTNFYAHKVNKVHTLSSSGYHTVSTIVLSNSPGISAETLRDESGTGVFYRDASGEFFGHKVSSSNLEPLEEGSKAYRKAKSVEGLFRAISIDEKDLDMDVSEIQKRKTIMDDYVIWLKKKGVLSKFTRPVTLNSRQDQLHLKELMRTSEKYWEQFIKTYEGDIPEDLMGNNPDFDTHTYNYLQNRLAIESFRQLSDDPEKARSIIETTFKKTFRKYITTMFNSRLSAGFRLREHIPEAINLMETDMLAKIATIPTEDLLNASEMMSDTLLYSISGNAYTAGWRFLVPQEDGGVEYLTNLRLEYDLNAEPGSIENITAQLLLEAQSPIEKYVEQRDYYGFMTDPTTLNILRTGIIDENGEESSLYHELYGEEKANKLTQAYKLLQEDNVNRDNFNGSLHSMENLSKAKESLDSLMELVVLIRESQRLGKESLELTPTITVNFETEVGIVALKRCGNTTTFMSQEFSTTTPQGAAAGAEVTTADAMKQLAGVNAHLKLDLFAGYMKAPNIPPRGGKNAEVAGGSEDVATNPDGTPVQGDAQGAGPGVKVETSNGPGL